MKLPLSKAEYKALARVAKHEGLTVDQAAQLAILNYLKERGVPLLAEVKKCTDPEVLKVFEKT